MEKSDIGLTIFTSDSKSFLIINAPNSISQPRQHIKKLMVNAAKGFFSKSLRYRYRRYIPDIIKKTKANIDFLSRISTNHYLHSSFFPLYSL